MSERKIVSPTDKELWENSCLTREQLRTWTDTDLAKHAVGVRKTLNYLFDLVDGVASMNEHRLEGGVLSRTKDGITARCTCGWVSSHFTILSASAAFSDHLILAALDHKS